MTENTLAFAIDLFEKTTRSRVHSIRKLEGGIANDLYFINLSFVLRIRLDNETDKPFYQPGEELSILKNTSGPISPELYAFDTSTGNMLCRYIKAGEMKEEKDASFRLYRNLIGSVKLLHAAKIDNTAISFFDPLERLKRYRELSETSFDANYEGRVVAEACDAFERSPKLLCHNNLNRSNFIYDSASDSVKLIDFEFASINYEIFDIASILSENGIDGRLRERLILSYYGAKNVTNELLEDVDRVIAFEDLFWYYWSMARYKETLRQDFLDIAKEKMARVRKRMRQGKKQIQ